MSQYKIRTALLSVSDKSGLLDFAITLDGLGVKIISTGGTYRTLVEGGIAAVEISSHTGFPEMMDGRVKTLHPKIHGGLLGRVSGEGEGVDAVVMAQHNITPIDLVVCNLYPFTQTVANPASTFADIIENIDIGGPAMVRSASKNFNRVACVVSPSAYESVAKELTGNDCSLNLARRFELARAAFAHVADYDVAIARYLESVDTESLA